MSKFWEWMKKKGYGQRYGGNDFDVIRYKVMEWGREMERRATHPSKQMLIGYMIQYIYEMDDCFVWEDGYELIHNAEDTYQKLEAEIEFIAKNENLTKNSPKKR